MQYLKTHPSLQNLNAHSWIELDEFNADAAQVRWLKQHVPERKCQYSFNSTLGVLAAVKEHSGLAFLPCAIIAQQLDLVQVLPPIAESDRNIWILVHEGIFFQVAAPLGAWNGHDVSTLG